MNERRVPLSECYKYDQLRVTYMVRGDNEKSGAVFAAQVYDEGTPSVSSWKWIRYSFSFVLFNLLLPIETFFFSNLLFSRINNEEKTTLSVLSCRGRRNSNSCSLIKIPLSKTRKLVQRESRWESRSYPGWLLSAHARDRGRSIDDGRKFEKTAPPARRKGILSGTEAGSRANIFVTSRSDRWLFSRGKYWP